MTVEHDTDRRRFVVQVNGDEAYLQYQPLKAKLLDYQSTYVPDHLRGRGIASAIVRHALEYARDQRLRVRASCWFVKDFMVRHPEYANVEETGRGKREG